MSTNDNPNRLTSVSQTRSILAYMREGHAITPQDARTMFGCDRLSGRIKDIEKIVGYKPPRRYVKVIGRDPEGRPKEKKVMSYWLEKES